jgi:hypothetical protein
MEIVKHIDNSNAQELATLEISREEITRLLTQLQTARSYFLAIADCLPQEKTLIAHIQKLGSQQDFLNLTLQADRVAVINRAEKPHAT